MNSALLDTIRLQVNTKLDPENKIKLGQFMTPSNIADYMASLFDEQSSGARLLDCGAGIGSLSISAIKALKDVELLSLWEIDPIMQKQLKKNMQNLAVNFSIHAQDFIFDAVENIISGRGERYTHAIINPPYQKIGSNSGHRKELKKVGINTANLYSAFLALTILLMEEGGQIVAIVPRSFCNGPYYRPFRKILLDQCSIDHVHVFERRNKAFQDDDVLQENIIIKLVKGKEQEYVEISHSTDQEFHDRRRETIAFDEIVRPNDREQFIHIPTDEQSIESSTFYAIPLSELVLEVSTGPVVDFRMKECLVQDPTEGAVPLLYPHHFVDGKLTYPRNHKKPNAIMVTSESRKWLMPNDGFYVVVKRFSAKEEKRRVVAYVVDPDEIENNLIGFENHWNVFHVKKHGFDRTTAMGLTCFLNSTELDNHFRLFSGHTQVNATDLKNMKYPSMRVLKELGENYQIFMDQEQTDRLLEGIGVNSKDEKLQQAYDILIDIGMPRQQQNERTALCLLCLLDVTPDKPWSQAGSPLVGITPIMDWSRQHYNKDYAPNTRETFRRQSMHQFVDAGICLYNPDKLDRPVNSPHAVYQIEANLLNVLKVYGTPQYRPALQVYLQQRPTLTQIYARERNMAMIPLQLEGSQTILLSAGAHSLLIKDIVESFGARYVPGGRLVYVGDTGDKHGFFDVAFLASLGIQLDNHGKLPDVVIYSPEKNWLFLIESVTSHGPVDHKRYGELTALFQNCSAGLVFVSAFPDSKTYGKYSSVIAWETEVWIADAPTHMIHFNGSRFLGPYST
jgi:adenine-specific DNA-methyltransferase